MRKNKSYFSGWSTMDHEPISGVQAWCCTCWFPVLCHSKVRHVIIEGMSPKVPNAEFSVMAHFRNASNWGEDWRTKIYLSHKVRHWVIITPLVCQVSYGSADFVPPNSISFLIFISASPIHVTKSHMEWRTINKTSTYQTKRCQNCVRTGKVRIRKSYQNRLAILLVAEARIVQRNRQFIIIWVPGLRQIHIWVRPQQLRSIK